MTPYHLLQETIKANKRFYATWRPVWAFHKWLWQRDAVRKKRTLGPHARVRLALVLLAHVVDRRQEPGAAPPAQGAEQAAGAAAVRPRARRVCEPEKQRV